MAPTPDSTFRRRLLPFLGAGPAHPGGRSAQTCRFRCGNACLHDEPNTSENAYFGDIVHEALSRRGLLTAGASTALVIGAGSVLGAAPAAAAPVRTQGHSHGGQVGADRLTFEAITPTNADEVVVPPGYDQSILVKWGDPILQGAPAFDATRQTAAAQAAQFGYNNDFVGFVPIPGEEHRAVLVVNHEYTNEELMFPGWTPETATFEQKLIGLAAHGMSVILIERDGHDGDWYLAEDVDAYNRRVTADSPLSFDGPVAGSPLVQTTDDRAGMRPLGTLNNCAGGVTPWGTVLSGEENFNQYFATSTPVLGADGAQEVDEDGVLVFSYPDGSVREGSGLAYTDTYKRYGFPTGPSERRWEDVQDRFDLTVEPNEGHRHGWIVEIDPLDKTSTPVKHTAMGRFKHEGATVRVARDGRVVAYMGDDERFDYVYKFVSHGTFRKGDGEQARAHNRTLLSSGDLYVARFTGDSPPAEIDGSGELPGDGLFDGTGHWLPLVVDGRSHVPGMHVDEVLVFTRLAADKVGPTKMDRPEEVQVSLASGAVYIALTNNSRRGAPDMAGVDEANPLALTKAGEFVGNKYGHVIEFLEDANDPTGTGFTWSIFIVCGNPEDPSSYYAGYDKSEVSPVSAPDNLMVDGGGNLWIATDGNANGTGFNDGFFAAPVEGPRRGHLKQFLSVPLGAEACGIQLSEDEKAIFLAVQHPGDGTGTAWPYDGTGVPRPSVVVVFREDGALIGT